MLTVAALVADRGLLVPKDSDSVSLLLVHADSDERAMYAEYFRSSGCSVIEVSSTDAALPVLADVDAVITGLMVPGTIFPTDFIGRVRHLWGDTPIVVVTACALSDRIDEAYRAGADVVLLKPCLPDDLLDEVRAVIESRNVRLVSPQDRRSAAERRAAWRGGRRDADWFLESMAARIEGAISQDDPDRMPTWTAHFDALKTVKPD